MANGPSVRKSVLNKLAERRGRHQPNRQRVAQQFLANEHGWRWELGGNNEPVRVPRRAEA